MVNLHQIVIRALIGSPQTVRVTGKRRTRLRCIFDVTRPNQTIIWRRPPASSLFRQSYSRVLLKLLQYVDPGMAVGDTTIREVSTESPILRVSTAYLRLATIICDSRCCKLDLTRPRMLQAVNRASTSW